MEPVWGPLATGLMKSVQLQHSTFPVLSSGGPGTHTITRSHARAENRLYYCTVHYQVYHQKSGPLNGSVMTMTWMRVGANVLNSLG